MRTALPGRFLLAALCLVLSPIVAGAQIYETVGTRAQGMAGAFVAVADDATATWWNPAGIASGALLGLSIEHSALQAPAGEVTTGPGWESGVNGFALTVPSLGLSYYRLRISEIAPLLSSTAPGGGVREDEVAVSLRSVSLSQFGATFGQSLGEHLVLASTLRLLRGGQAIGSTVVPATGRSSTADSAFAQAADLDVDAQYRIDLDVGVMVTVGGMRVGGSVRHLREPEFGEGATAIQLERQARIGAAWLGGERGVLSGWTVAFDADVTRTDTALGPVRHLAGGAEAWLWKRRLGLRGGLSTNALGDKARSTSVGLSLSPRAGLSLDGALTRGADETLEGWSAALRMTF